MLLVPDLGKVAGDLEQHTLVRHDLPRTFFPNTSVKIADRRAQRATTPWLNTAHRRFPLFGMGSERWAIGQRAAAHHPSLNPHNAEREVLGAACTCAAPTGEPA